MNNLVFQFELILIFWLKLSILFRFLRFWVWIVFVDGLCIYFVQSFQFGGQTVRGAGVGSHIGGVVRACLCAQTKQRILNKKRSVLNSLNVFFPRFSHFRFENKVFCVCFTVFYLNNVLYTYGPYKGMHSFNY